MTALEQLATLEPACTREEALTLFDGLPAVSVDDLTGRWHGRELATGHALDGLLEASGWYGKQFDGPDQVHPLLFRDGSGDVFPVDPKKVPLGVAARAPSSLVERGRGLLGVLKPALRTKNYRARLRAIEHRGVLTAAMVYDHLPIIDTFRRVDGNTVLGIMDLRNNPEPYFFILTKI